MQTNFSKRAVSDTKAVVELKVQETTIKKAQRVAVYSIYDARLSYVGRVSGEQYIWSKIDESVLVLTEDVPYLLEKRLGSRSCCGGMNQDGNRVFEIRS